MSTTTFDGDAFNTGYSEARTDYFTRYGGSPLALLAAVKRALCQSSTIANYPGAWAQGRLDGAISALDDLMEARWTA